jgi:hypothetical protein
MMRKAAVVLVPLIAVGAAVVMQRKDISRYFKIARMSFGNGKPENVPATGTKRYPDGPGKGIPDGTGSFDSASRGGGPAVSRRRDAQPADRPALADAIREFREAPPRAGQHLAVPSHAAHGSPERSSLSRIVPTVNCLPGAPRRRLSGAAPASRLEWGYG